MTGARDMEALTMAEMEELGRYNAESHRGLLHNQDTVERMAVLQRRFDERMAHLEREAEWCDAQLEFLRRTVPPRWVYWLCLAIAVGAALFGMLRVVL